MKEKFATTYESEMLQDTRMIAVENKLKVNDVIQAMYEYIDSKNLWEVVIAAYKSKEK